MGLATLDPDDITSIAKQAPYTTELELSSNNLTDLPDEVANLRYVRKIHMKYNKLTRLPYVLTKLPQLQARARISHQPPSTVADCTVLSSCPWPPCWRYHQFEGMNRPFGNRWWSSVGTRSRRWMILWPN